MRRSSLVPLALGAALVAFAARAEASPVALGAPAAPVPAAPGTGLPSIWARGTPDETRELDEALTLLSSSAYRLDGVGPVSLSNELADIGDYATHATMPYSPSGIPEGPGPSIAARMVGFWAVRAAGTYTMAIGCDDGYRVTVAGTVVLDQGPAQPFRRAAVSLEASSAGLYPITVEYFNGVQEGAIELSFAPGAIDLASPTTAIAPPFALIPKEDLYPLAGDADAGPLYPPAAPDAGPAPASDAGAPASGADAASAPYPSTTPNDGASSAGETAAAIDAQYHGGGCAHAPAGDDATDLAPLSLGALAIATRRRRKR